MHHDLDQTLALLSHTPHALTGLLRDLPDAWTQRDEGENTWTVVAVIGHLIHSERTNFLPRVKFLLQFGGSRPFEPFDRGYEHEVGVKSLPELLDEFAHLRSENIAELRALDLQPEDMARQGLHPALGAVTLSQLLAAWAAHDLTHLHQITRIMAHQYREAVGPWSKFLGVLKCSGHSGAA